MLSQLGRPKQRGNATSACASGRGLEELRCTSWLCPNVRIGMRQVTHNIVPHVSLDLKTPLSFSLRIISTTKLTIEDIDLSMSCSRREMFPNQQINKQKTETTKKLLPIPVPSNYCHCRASLAPPYQRKQARQSVLWFAIHPFHIWC